MNLPTKMSFAILALMISSFILATEETTAQSPGQKLHDNKCLSCHTTKTYSREDHTIKSLKALESRVKACMNPAKAEWSQAQQNDVVKYLDENFYKF